MGQTFEPQKKEMNVEENRYMMKDLAARDPRSFKAWRAGQDDGRTKQYLKWAKHQKNLSEMDLIDNYRKVIWASSLPGNNKNPSSTNILIPILGISLGIFLVFLFQ